MDKEIAYSLVLLSFAASASAIAKVKGKAERR